MSADTLKSLLTWSVLPLVGALIGTAGALWGAHVGMVFGGLVGGLTGTLILARQQAEKAEERPVSVHPQRLQAIRDSGLELPRTSPQKYPTRTRVIPVSASASAILTDLLA
jgi:hypothetical protein